MNVLKLWNTKNYILVALISLMLITSFAASNIVTVKAQPFPWSITLHATETTNPFWGYYGGYHDVWYAIRSELAKIGINLVIDYYDDFTWWSHTSSSTNWEKNATEGGWDMYIQEWWLQPHAIEPWFSSMVLSYLEPPQGYNLHPWNNSKADELLEKALRSFDAQTRQYYLWKWQEVFMDDPPWINIWYPRIYEVMGGWVEGYDPTGCWWYDTTNLSLNPSAMSTERQKLNTDWLYYACSEDVWALLPMYMDTYTEEQMCTLQWRTLYRWSINWTNFVEGVEPAPTDYLIAPDLAAKDPYAVGGNYSRMRVELREGAKWSDFATSGQYVDAEDVEFTFNDIVLEKKAKGTGYGDFIEVIDRVEIVNNTAVDFILKNPAPDLKSILANDWGTGSILPYHKLSAYEADPTLLNKDPSNTEFDDPTQWLPVTGPFKLKQIVPGEFCLLERNPLYFGFDASVVGSPAWGPDASVQAIYLKWVPDAAVRLLEFQTHKLDVGEYPTAPIEVWKDLETDPYLNVFQYNYPASNPIWINFNHKYLSNRFIRLAIAHAVPFEKITSEILPSWGIETSYPGKTYIMPVHYYTEPDDPLDPELNGDTVHLFNTELEAWHYDIQKAEEYMWLWYNSTTVSNSAIGAVGDANYGGLVDLDDFLIWSANTETGPDTWPQTVVPGNIIDPDFNNDNNVDPGTDFPLWASHYGVEY